MNTNDWDEEPLDSQTSPSGARAPRQRGHGGLDAIDLLRLEEEAEHTAELDAIHLRTDRLHILAQLDAELEAEHENDKTFTSWKSPRRLDPTDFDFFFHHRQKLDEARRQLLEVVAAKIRHVRRDGEAGYFNRLNEHFDYAESLAAIILSGSIHARKLAFCGIKAGGKNSGRCKMTDLCPLCLWLETKRLAVESFGRRSSAFGRASAWFFITCGFSSEKKNSRSVGLDVGQVQLNRRHTARVYDAFPVQLGDTGQDRGVDAIGCDDAQLLCYVAQKSFEELRKAKLVNGYRSKLEGAFRVRGYSPTRVNLHGHCIANGDIESAQSVADHLFASMSKSLEEHKQEFYGIYHPDVLVQRLESREDLHRCLVYQEKTIPVAAVIKSGLEAARSSKGLTEFSAQGVENLLTNLCRLTDENLAHIFDTLVLGEKLTARLYRRKSAGNMACGAKRQYIGDEPRWHVDFRKKRSATQKQRREKQLLEEEYREQGSQPVKKKNRRRRKK